MKIFAKKFKNISRKLVILVAFFSILVTSQNSYSAIGRQRTCSADGVPEGLDFSYTDGGKDANFVLTNPVCVAVIATTYAATKGLIATMNGLCGGSFVPRILPSPIQDAMDIAKGIRTAAGGNVKCGVSVLSASAAYGVALGELYAVYSIASAAYDRTSVCGSDWTEPNPIEFTMGSPKDKKTVRDEIDEAVKNPDRVAGDAVLTNTNKSYREWLNDGEEYTDKPDSGETCLDPTRAKDSDGKYPAQRYYLKGLAAGNYGCGKYRITEGYSGSITVNGTSTAITPEIVQDFKTAYNCCKKRASSYICIDDKSSGAKFCEAGSRCILNGITYETKYLDQNRFVCAQSYSVCPYNFMIGGGSEYCDYYNDGIWNEDAGSWTMIKQEDVLNHQCSAKSEIRNSDCTYNKKANKCRNYCQYMKHCTVTSNLYEYRSGITSPYFSTACMNFVGDSQNKISYGSDISFGGITAFESQRHFSAPIAQCVKETLENVFYDRAGHSKCLDDNEYPSSDGSCASGKYDGSESSNFVFKKGNKVKALSFFSMLQNTLQTAVKLVITLSIMFYGMNILIGKSDIRQKKDIMTYLFKIAIVLYFATGDAWQSTFFEGVYGTSSTFAQMVFKIAQPAQENLRDGCQFGDISLRDGTSASSGKTYPAGKDYLAIWDTLDCKIARYLGFGPQLSAANIALLIFACALTGSIGLAFAMALMFFGFLFICVTIRALHIFLSSCIAIIIMVFVSPIIIPTILFAKTSSIFKTWATQLFSFVLQPMILFAYIGLLFTTIDKVMIGSATFAGPGPFKVISCSTVCKDVDDNIVGDGITMPACDQVGQRIVDPLNDSVACLIDVNSFGKVPGLEIIGISIPVMINLFSSNVKERFLTLVRAAMIMYLLYQFMDEIPGITTRLIGGEALPGNKASAFAKFKEAFGIASGIQKRLTRLAGKGLKKGGKAARDKINSKGDQGKQTADRNPSSGDNTPQVGSSKGAEASVDSSSSKGGSVGSSKD